MVAERAAAGLMRLKIGDLVICAGELCDSGSSLDRTNETAQESTAAEEDGSSVHDESRERLTKGGYKSK